MHLALFIVAFSTLTQAAKSPASSLNLAMDSYFRAAKTSDRAKIAVEISEHHPFDDVASQLSRLALWPVQKESPQQISTGQWKFTLPSGQAVNAEYVLPPEYDGNQPIPLFVTLEKPDATSPGVATEQITASISAAWVALDKPVGGSFHQSTTAAGDLPGILREIRRKIHVDTDRTYLLGVNANADAAWVAAMMYPHPFAEVIAVSGFPHIPYPEQSYALLLPNLRNTRFVSIWTDDTNGANTTAKSAINQAIANFAQAAQLPFETATLAANQTLLKPVLQREIAAATSRPRRPQSKVESWFRYLPQGNAGWLRVTDLAGDVWTDEQISIAVTASEDRDQFITETLKQKFFYLNGRIDGQTITIETRRVAAVELRLSPEQVDFSKPVTVVVNGRKRFDGVLEPSIKDLLESAYEDWDFQHPIYARKSFSINAQ